MHTMPPSTGHTQLNLHRNSQIVSILIFLLSCVPLTCIFFQSINGMCMNEQRRIAHKLPMFFRSLSHIFFFFFISKLKPILRYTFGQIVFSLLER